MLKGGRSLTVHREGCRRERGEGRRERGEEEGGEAALVQGGIHFWQTVLRKSESVKREG